MLLAIWLALATVKLVRDAKPKTSLGDVVLLQRLHVQSLRLD